MNDNKRMTPVRRPVTTTTARLMNVGAKFNGAATNSMNAEG